MSFLLDKDGKKHPVYFTESGCRTAAQGTKLYHDDVKSAVMQPRVRKQANAAKKAANRHNNLMARAAKNQGREIGATRKGK